MNIPASFGTSVTVKHYRKGEDILNSPPYRLTTCAPMTEYHGWYGRRAADHAWGVRVYAALSKKVIVAYATVRDGFEADLNEEPEFLKGLDERSHVFARFERKHFRWGNAVSFLSTSYQDTPDREFYVPDNNHLKYEVWGVTRNRQYTVLASMYVRHPKLRDWGPEVRIAKNIKALKEDRDYKLIEICSTKQFEPSLAAFDQLVGSLNLQ